MDEQRIDSFDELLLSHEAHTIAGAEAKAQASASSRRFFLCVIAGIEFVFIMLIAKANGLSGVGELLLLGFLGGLITIPMAFFALLIKGHEGPKVSAGDVLSRGGFITKAAAFLGMLAFQMLILSEAKVDFFVPMIAGAVLGAALGFLWNSALNMGESAE